MSIVSKTKLDWYGEFNNKNKIYKKSIKLKKNNILILNENILIFWEVYMKIIDKIALVLVIIGAIVWGIIGIFNFNIVDALFGEGSIISRIIYTLVGISGLWAIKLLFDD